ncbi:MAG: ERF family protein [Methanobrevibacter sp.]|nr:ERF family protein [Methanobrevibacter sp.]
MTKGEIINAISEKAKGTLKPDLATYGKNYRAISESAILEVLNPLFKEYGLFYEVRVDNTDLRIEKINSGLDQAGNLIQTLVFVATVRVQLYFGTHDTPCLFIFDGVGMGIDSGDKAMGKALTGATKYALLKGFRLQYSYDPDAEKSEDINSITKAAETKEAPKKKKQEKEKTSTEAKADKKALATEGQLSYIKGLVSRLSMADEVFQSEFGCMPYDTNITMSDARKIIDRLKEIEEEGLPF